MKNNIEELKKQMREDKEAVSYTHLDVYKRQEYHSTLQQIQHNTQQTIMIHELVLKNK